jgi:hypothetical protein
MITSFIIRYPNQKDNRKKNPDAIEFCELGDVYQIVEHRLCRPTADETVAQTDEHTRPGRNPIPQSHL